MAHAIGTLLSTDGSRSTTFRDAIETLLTAHAAWEFVHEGANGWRIWRCKGTDNFWGEDFYFAMRTSGANQIIWRCFEQYDQTNQLIRKPCIRGNTAHVVASDGSIGDTWYARTDAYGLDGAQIAGASYVMSLGSDESDYYLQATKDYVLGFSLGSGVALFGGLFNTFIPGNANEFPLVAADLRNSSTAATQYTQGGWSRHPGREGVAGHNSHFGIWPLGINSAIGRLTPLVGRVGGDKDIFHDAPVGMRRLLMSIQGSASFGYMRGVLFDMMMFDVDASQVGFLDTLTIDGLLYRCMIPVTGATWWVHDPDEA